MHDGGSKMVLYINNKEVCTSQATYGKGGDNNDQTIVGLSRCPATIPFNKGDVMTLDAFYDLATHPLYAFPLLPQLKLEGFTDTKQTRRKGTEHDAVSSS